MADIPAVIGFIDAVRVVGYNYKEQFYDQDHKRFPDKVFLGSENGHGEDAWRAVTEREYICGQFLWTGIDYLGEAHGWPIHGSGAGLLTTAGFPKERYYERRRLWLGSDEAGAGEKESAADTDHSTDDGSFSTRSVMTPGTVISVSAGIYAACWRPVRAKSEGMKVRPEEASVWHASDEQSDSEMHPGRFSDHRSADWEQRTQEIGFIDQILIRLKDPQGHTVTDDDRIIEVTVEGAGELAGLDNGDLSDNTPYTSRRRRTLRGDLAAYVRRTAEGEIRVAIRLCE